MTCPAIEAVPIVDPHDRHPVAPVDTATVVVVTEDPHVVASMRTAAEERSGAWDVHVVGDGTSALLLVRELTNVDVVLAHVHLAGLGTTDLLEAIRRRTPHAARIVMSGRDDRDAALGLIGLAHQVVSLPFDIEHVTGMIEQIRCGSGTRLCDPVRTIVGHVDKLPSPPAMFQRLGEIISSDDWSIDDLADEIANDLALTGEVLKLVNSSFYATAERITSLSRAITLVGVDMIRFIVLGSKVFEPDDELETWIDLDRLARRSNGVALGARALAIRERASTDTSSLAYLAGLVSEIGLLVLGRIPDISPTITAPVNGSTFLGAERAIFGGDRFAVGAHLLTLWGFDRTVVDAVRRLSSGDIVPTGLPWYLAASRHLVLEHAVDPYELAVREGTKPDLDDAIEDVREVLGDGASGAVTQP